MSQEHVETGKRWIVQVCEQLSNELKDTAVIAHWALQYNDLESGDSSELAPRLPCKGKSVRNRGVSQTMPFLVIPRSLLRGGFIRWGLLHACTCATHMCNTHALDCLGTHLCRVTHPLRDSAGGLAT